MFVQNTDSGRRIVDEGDLGGSSKIGSVVTSVQEIGAESIYTGSINSLIPLVLMTHEIDPTVKIWLGYGRDEDPTKRTILFDIETARTPQPGEPTVNRISSAVLRGVSHEGRLIGREARDQEQEGNRDTRVRQV